MELCGDSGSHTICHPMQLIQKLTVQGSCLLICSNIYIFSFYSQPSASVCTTLWHTPWIRIGLQCKRFWQKPGFEFGFGELLLNTANQVFSGTSQTYFFLVFANTCSNKLCKAKVANYKQHCADAEKGCYSVWVRKLFELSEIWSEHIVSMLSTKLECWCLFSA